MIAPFQTLLRLPWPLGGPPNDYSRIDTSVEAAPWHVAGDWRMPPGEVCDLLTAKSYEFSFSFSSSAFNSEFGEEFPEDVSYSVVLDAGTWIYYDTATEPQTLNINYKWDTQVKLFERDLDPEEGPEYFDQIGNCGIRYTKTLIDPEFGTTQWFFSLSMFAYYPSPVKDQDGNYVWVLSDLNGFFGCSISKRIGTDPATEYPMTGLGGSYLGINDRGGQGVGRGGCFPVASVAIESHFPA
jgi:hypothetical protein